MALRAMPAPDGSTPSAAPHVRCVGGEQFAPAANAFTSFSCCPASAINQRLNDARWFSPLLASHLIARDIQLNLDIGAEINPGGLRQEIDPVDRQAVFTVIEEDVFATITTNP